LLQVPVDGQLASDVQAMLFLTLHLPLRIAQSLAAELQVFWLMLHLPLSGQSLCAMQLLPVALHAPACGTQLASDVQLNVVWMLHLPGSGVQTGGAQVVTGVQVPSGSGFWSQPAGLNVVVQTCGWHVCVPGSLQV